MGTLRVTVDTDDLVRRYNAGESVLAISKAVGVSRPTVRNRLLSLGLPVRSASEANRIRMDAMTPEERKANALCAHEARRATPPSDEELSKKASTKERTLSKVGWGELLLADMLKAKGHHVELQKAVGPYNLDLCVGHVAIEVHVNSGNPMRMYSRRIDSLIAHGFDVVYVWVTHRYGISSSTADCVDTVIRAESPGPYKRCLVVRGDEIMDASLGRVG